MHILIKTFRLSLLYIILVLTSLSTHAIAQSSNKDIIGDWKGTLVAGGKSIPLVFHIKNNSGTLNITMDIPSQGAVGLICQDAVFGADSISFNYKQNIFYKGKLTDTVKISGTYTQSGLNLPFNLIKSDDPKDSTSVLLRPQTPTPPFPYISRDVVYNSPDGKLQYGATITMPDSTGKFPAILLVTGSGPENRDEEMFGHKPFAVLADFLTRAGYLVMRVDDRGVGESTGDFKACTTFDFAEDASNSLNYLKNLPQTDKQKIGILGHSEGALIAEILAAKRPDLDFIILMAGPGVAISRAMTLQNAATKERNMPMMPANVRSYDSVIYSKVVKALLSSTDTLVIHARMQDSIHSYNQIAQPAFLGDKKGWEAIEHKTADLYFKSMVEDIWFNKFIRIDVRDYLAKIKCKVLALNGSEDFQVTPKENLAGIKTALSNGNSKDFEVIELPGLNHLFQRCNECTFKEYGKLTQTLDPSLLNTIKDWLLRKVPANK